MTRIATQIAIVGGGVIGLATAIRLAAERYEVVVLDPNEPGSGASYGNAGTIADYGVVPVGTPAVLRNLPALLLDRDSPLALRASGLPALAPWLLRFARQSLSANARRNAAALAVLVADALSDWGELAAQTGTQDLVNRNGCLYLYRSRKAFEAAAGDMALRKAHGVAQEFLEAGEVAGLEPNLPPFEGGGVFFPKTMHLSNPGAMMRRLAATAEAAGVRFIKAKAGRLQRARGGVEIRAGSVDVEAKTVVIAAGAHSRPLAAMAGDRVPLDTERGYHVEFDMAVPPLSRPVCPTSRGFYLVPMAGRLRVAGTVELGGLTPPPNPRRLNLLVRGARAFFPALDHPNRTWMGFRPSMPDSVPVIGYSHGGSEVILAFGHGHLGLTLAPTTARMVADLIIERIDPAAAAAYSPSRF